MSKNRTRTVHLRPKWQMPTLHYKRINGRIKERSPYSREICLFPSPSLFCASMEPTRTRRQRERQTQLVTMQPALDCFKVDQNENNQICWKQVICHKQITWCRNEWHIARFGLKYFRGSMARRKNSSFCPRSGQQACKLNLEVNFCQDSKLECLAIPNTAQCWTCQVNKSSEI